MSGTSGFVTEQAQVVLWKIARVLTKRLWGSFALLIATGKLWLLLFKSREVLPVEVLLVPYDTPACVIQHQAFAVILRGLTRKSRIRVLHPKVAKRQIEFAKERTLLPEADLAFQTFSDLLDYLFKFANSDLEVARGVIDQFTRTCAVSAFFGPHLIPREFLVQISAEILVADLVSPRSGVLLLADRTYAFNCALVSNGRKNRSRIWVVNPDGQLSQGSSSGSHHRFLQTLEDADLSVASNSELVAAAGAYFEDRFYGSEDVDFDSGNGAKGLDKIPAGLEQKKILCLHAFRDASDFPISGGGSPWQFVFRTYFEWADFCLSKIAEDKENWAIRPHPSGWGYPGDTEIFRGLLTKHGLQDITFADDVSIRSILEARLPVYTHSGTVALEAAAFGYRAFVASNRFPDALTVRAKTPEEYGTNLKLQFEEARILISNESRSEASKVLLFRSLKNRSLGFVPEPRQPSRFSELAFQRDLVMQSMSLSTMLLRRRGLEKLRKDAEFILAQTLKS